MRRAGPRPTRPDIPEDGGGGGGGGGARQRRWRWRQRSTSRCSAARPKSATAWNERSRKLCVWQGKYDGGSAAAPGEQRANSVFSSKALNGAVPPNPSTQTLRAGRARPPPFSALWGAGRVGAGAAFLAAKGGRADQTYNIVNMSGVDDMARCLDGSPYIFYVAPGDENVMIWLEGGG